MILQSLFKSILMLKNPKVTDFDGVIEIATMFIKATFKDSKKLK